MYDAHHVTRIMTNDVQCLCACVRVCACECVHVCVCIPLGIVYMSVYTERVRDTHRQTLAHLGSGDDDVDKAFDFDLCVCVSETNRHTRRDKQAHTQRQTGTHADTNRNTHRDKQAHTHTRAAF
jgi:hypothetical protein